MKKLALIVLTLLMALTFCFGMTACSDKIVEQIQNEIGAILEGGNFKEGSILNMVGLDVTEEQADEIFEKLEGIGVEIDDKTKAYIYDIFVSKDNQEVQPDGTVKITVPMPQEGAENGYSVYHVKDSGEIERISSTYKDGKLSFEADGFSYYVFVANSYVSDSSIISKYSHKLTITVEPANVGHIEIGGEEKDVSNGIFLNAGESHTLTAVANDGYQFVGWYDADLNEMLAEDDVYDLYLNKNRNLIAKFKETPYELAVTSGSGGSAKLDGVLISDRYRGSVDRNASVTLTAVADFVYEFVGWYNKADSSLLSTSETYTFTMDGDKSIEAKFKHRPVGVSFEATPAGSGYFEYNNVKYDEIDQNWEVGTEYTVKAVPNFGYEFLRWEKGSEQIRGNVVSGTVGETSFGYRAVFVELRYQLEVKAVGGGKVGVTAIDNIREQEVEFVTEYKKAFNHVNSVELAVQADEGYRFIGWYNEFGENVSESDSYTVMFTRAAKIKLEARFEKITYQFKATASEGGSLTENGSTVVFTEPRTVDHGTVITLTAVEAANYVFVGWYKGEQLLSEEETYRFTVTSNMMDVGAKFVKRCKITVTVDPVGKGWITKDEQTVDYSSGKEYLSGTELGVTAEAVDGYRFVGWYDADTQELIMEDDVLSLTVEGDRNLIAKFELIPPTMYRFICKIRGNGSIWENNANATETYQYGASLAEGTKITLTAKPDTYWAFKGWYKSNETLISTDVTYTFDLTDHTSVYALFEEKIMYLFLAQSSPVDGGYITENGTRVDFGNGRKVDPNAQITLTAVANTGYKFKCWGTFDGNWNLTVLSTNATNTFTVTEKTSVYAVFEELTFLAQCDPYNGGYITANGTRVDFGNGRQVEMNAQITLTAVANAGYEFKCWGTRDNDWNLTVLSTDATHTFTITERTYVQAVFEEKATGLKLDGHNAGFTYKDGALTTTVYQIGDANQPQINNVLVYATYPTQADKSLTIDVDYTRNLGGLDFTRAGTYTVTYTYKKDTSLTVTLTVQVVTDGALTETEWNAAMTYWSTQTNVKVFERIVTKYSYDPNYGSMGADIRIYQLSGTAYSEDGYFENDESSQNYQGKMSYFVKVGDKYYSVEWYEEYDESLQDYTGKWVKSDYCADLRYNDALSNNIYACRDICGNKIDFNYANFTFDATAKAYKNSDGSISIAFTFDDSKVLTKIVVTEVNTEYSQTSESTITFGDAVVNVPTNTKCSFSIGVQTEDSDRNCGYITENGTRVDYWCTYLDDGTVLTLKPVANDGYVFKCWGTYKYNNETKSLN